MQPSPPHKTLAPSTATLCHTAWLTHEQGEAALVLEHAGLLHLWGHLCRFRGCNELHEASGWLWNARALHAWAQLSAGQRCRCRQSASGAGSRRQERAGAPALGGAAVHSLLPPTAAAAAHPHVQQAAPSSAQAHKQDRERTNRVPVCSVLLPQLVPEERVGSKHNRVSRGEACEVL